MVQVNDTPWVPRTLRIRFEKTGALQYISHLDLMRTMTRAMSRAGLPVKYTEGFNPIPHLIFSAPLPVGAESPREFVDITLTREVDFGEAVARLNATLPRELKVAEVYYPTTKFSEITAAEYRLRIRTAGGSGELAARCAALLAEKPLVVRKHTKSGIKDVDVSPAILSCGGEYDADEDEIVLSVKLRAESGSFLKPGYLTGYLSDRLGILTGNPTEEWCAVTRTHLFTKDGADFS